MNNLETARAAHSAAAARHRKLMEDAGRARQALAEAESGKQAALDHAAKGEAITTKQLRAADEATRDAADAHALAEAVAASGKAAVDAAHVAVLEADARGIEAESTAALAQQAEAGAEVAEKLAAARDALARMQAASARATAALCAAGEFNYGMAARAATNGVLAAQHGGEWPRAHVACGGADVAKLRVALGRGVDPWFDADPVRLGIVAPIATPAMAA